MKSFFGKAALSAAFLFAAVFAPVLSYAQESSVSKPAVVVALKSIDGIVEDVEFGMDQAGYGDQAAMLQASLGMLQGVDTTKPIGINVWFEENEPKMLAMLPVTDYETFLDLIGQGVDIEEEDDFAIIDLPTGQSIRMKSVGGYVFVSESEDAFKKLPKNPAKSLTAARGERLFSAKVFVQRIPAELRDKAVEMMKEGFDRAMDQNAAGENIAEMQRRINEVSMKNLIEVVQKSDKIDFGFTMDQKNKKLRWDLNSSGIEGSKMARQANAMVGKKGKLAHFLLNDVAAHFYGFGVVLEEDKQNVKDMLSAVKDGFKAEMKENGNLPKDASQFLSSLIDDSLELVEEAANSGRLDFGGVVDAGEKLNALFGASIGSGEKFDALVKKIVTKVSEKAGGKVKVTNKSVGGVKFTVVEGPVAGDPSVERMFGNKIQIMAGRDGKIGYIAFGGAPDKIIKKVMGNSGKQTKEMLRYNIRLAKILNFVSQVAPNAPEAIEAMLDAIDEEGDSVTISGGVVKNGNRVSLMADAALLKLIGAAIQQAQRGPQF